MSPAPPIQQAGNIHQRERIMLFEPVAEQLDVGVPELAISIHVVHPEAQSREE